MVPATLRFEHRTPFQQLLPPGYLLREVRPELQIILLFITELASKAVGMLSTIVPLESGESFRVAQPGGPEIAKAAMGVAQVGLGQRGIEMLRSVPGPVDPQRPTVAGNCFGGTAAQA